MNTTVGLILVIAIGILGSIYLSRRTVEQSNCKSYVDKIMSAIYTSSRLASEYKYAQSLDEKKELLAKLEVENRKLSDLFIVEQNINAVTLNLIYHEFVSMNREIHFLSESEEHEYSAERLDEFTKINRVIGYRIDNQLKPQFTL